MPRGMTDRQLGRMKGRWFKDSVKIYQIKGRTGDRENRTLIDTANCKYIGASGSTLTGTGQAQNFDATVLVRTITPSNDRNGRYRLTVSVVKSKQERTDPDGPAEQKREVKLESVQMSEYPDPDGNDVIQIFRCINAKD